MINRNNAEAEFCGRIPLHQTNLIQPHGALLIVQKSNGTIIQCSENTEAFVGYKPTDLVGRGLEGLLSPEDKTALEQHLAESTAHKFPIILTLQKGAVLALVHQTDTAVVIEVEALESEALSFVTVHNRIKNTIQSLTDAPTIEEACTQLAGALKKISGFDKVMIYRFDEEWNGNVLAEAMEEDMESYLHFTFPASDIPKPARDMYQRNPYRLIPNIDYEPVRLYPVINSIAGGFTDLTDTNLRSVAPVHIEYLRNMKVTASMSTRIIKDGKLWGLIACHHKTPKYLPYSLCSVFELLSDVISNKITSVDITAAYNRKKGNTVVLQEVMQSWSSGNNVYDIFSSQGTAILQLLSAGGACLSLNNRTSLIGKTPPQPEVQDLLYWLESLQHKLPFQTHQLSVQYDAAVAYANVASGILVLPFGKKRGDCIIAFRPEAVQEIAWGGNPDEALRIEEDGRTYHPRHSFKMWKEMVRRQAYPWTADEVETAQTIQLFLSALASQ